jgi:hypothetical protein
MTRLSLNFSDKSSSNFGKGIHVGFYFLERAKSDQGVPMRTICMNVMLPVDMTWYANGIDGLGFVPMNYLPRSNSLEYTFLELAAVPRTLFLHK